PQVSAMRCGLLPISRPALLLGDVAYFDFRGEVEDEADRVELQKSLGPTCKILVLRNHGALALGDTAEEAFYSIFHLQAACEIQVSALASAGGAENLIVLERAKHRPHEVGSVRWAGSTFGPMQKSRLGEHEFEALMRMLDNLGYRTGYTYRYPFVQEKSKPKSDVLIPATVTAFVFEEEPAPLPALRQHAQKQQKEKTRWLNTPNTYLRVNVAEEPQGSAGSQRTKTTWLKADEVEKGSSGTPIRIENPNQFVPLYTDPQEVLEMRNKVRSHPQNPHGVRTRGPCGPCGSGGFSPSSPPVSPPRSGSKTGRREGAVVPNLLKHREMSPAVSLCSPGGVPAPMGVHTAMAPKPPLGMNVPVGHECLCRWLWQGTPPPPSQRHSRCYTPQSTNLSPPKTTAGLGGRAGARGFWLFIVSHGVCLSVSTTSPCLSPPRPPAVNGKDEEPSAEESKGGGQPTAPPSTDTETPKEKETVTSSPVSPEGSPSKSPSKKKKKFRTPSFLKKGKKKEKIEA
ncbi:ADDB protein, partial [Alopecoenas beccarii]|nr:ADDB protein [Alopecoenas beccarii]